MTTLWERLEVKETKCCLGLHVLNSIPLPLLYSLSGKGLGLPVFVYSALFLEYALGPECQMSSGIEVWAQIKD